VWDSQSCVGQPILCGTAKPVWDSQSWLSGLRLKCVRSEWFAPNGTNGQPEWDSQSWLSGLRLKCVHTEALQHRPSQKPRKFWGLTP